MYLTYKPEGSTEAKRFKYDPNKLRSVEQEMLERRSGMSFAKFTQNVLEGHSGCRRALLYMFLKRENSRLRYEDVDFAWDEVDLQYSKQEYALMREKISEVLSGEELRTALEQIDQEMETAYDDSEDGEGKARLPIAG